jgi:hypothetical protein
MPNTAFPLQSVYLTLSLPQSIRRVLWTDLNRSEWRLQLRAFQLRLEEAKRLRAALNIPVTGDYQHRDTAHG